jgi:hypothetical protein
MPELFLTQAPTLDSTREPALTPDSMREPALTPDSTREPVLTPASTLEPMSTPDSTREPALTQVSTLEPMSTPAPMAGGLSMAASSSSRCALAAGVRQTPLPRESGGWWPLGC